MAAAEIAAEHLVDAGLAEALPNGHYWIPELVRAYVREMDPLCSVTSPLPCKASVPPTSARPSD